MKKILIFVFVFYIFSFNLILAGNTSSSTTSSSSSSSNSSNNGASKDIKVRVTEKIPWANCICSWNTLNGVCYGPANWFDNYPPAEYTCTITPWFGTVMLMIWGIIKWFTAIAALWGVLFIVVNWLMLSMHGWEATKIKERITKTLIWLILLLLSGVILSIIAPWVYK